MNSKHCEKCVADWPPHHFSCPVCGEKTESGSKQPMDEATYKWLLYTKKGRLASVPKSEKEKIEQEWAALDAEVARREGFWSHADLIGEGFKQVA